MARGAEERELDAAERALGTLSRDGEGAADAALRERWEMRFAALGAVIPPVAPPPGLYRGIRERIALESTVADLAAGRRRRRGWRGATVMMGAVAAGLAALILTPGALDRVQREIGVQPSIRYVALVTHNDQPSLTGLIVQIDPETGRVTLVPNGVAPPEGSDYEIWHVADGDARSLGLFPADRTVLTTVSVEPGDEFAITQEPIGGSQGRTPGAQLFHGVVTQAAF